MRKITLLAFVFQALAVIAQSEDDARKYAGTILQDDLKDHLTIIASDALEGRDTGKRGQKMAAAYIKAHFESLGLKGPVKDAYGEGYYQRVPLYTGRPVNSYLMSGNEKVQLFEGFFPLSNRATEGEKTFDVVFGGKGSEAELKAAGVSGKLVMIIYTEGVRNVGRIVLPKATELGALGVLAIPATGEKEWNGLQQMYTQYLSGGRLSLDKPTSSTTAYSVAISPGVAEKLMGQDFDKLEKAANESAAGKTASLKKIKPGKLTLNIAYEVVNVNTENVLGYLEGTDKKDELIVITAHYDHVGRNGNDIYNGADDDGSGTVSVLEIAEAFVKAKAEGKGPRRSILFMTVTGEEKGLLGSDYYTRNPIFPLSNTVVNLNIDMVGRIDPEHEGKKDYVYLVGSNRLSTELHEISENVNASFSGLDLDYTYNDENHPDRIYYRSDHWNFAKNNVPIIFYFNGVHADYHKPTDTVDKIEFPALEKRARLVFYTAWVLANREDRIVVDKPSATSVDSK